MGLKVLYRAGLEKSSNHQTVLRRRWSCWSLVASHLLLLYSMMIITATIHGLTEHNDIIRLPFPCLSMWKDRGISAKSFGIMLKNSFTHQVGMCFLPLTFCKLSEGAEASLALVWPPYRLFDASGMFRTKLFLLDVYGSSASASP